MSVRLLEYADETGITAAVHTKYRHLKIFKNSDVQVNSESCKL